MRISVVGLGPGPAEWITAAARSRLHLPGASVFVRTRFLPQLAGLLDGVEWRSFDDLYERASSLSEVTSMMVAELLSAPSDEVVLAVPGDGAVGESVLSALRSAGATIDIIPGVAFGSAALAAAGVAASEGAQFVEATALGGTGIDLHIELNPGWPAVISGVFNPAVASEVKLALQRVYPVDHSVMLVHHPALADQVVSSVPLSDVDRAGVSLDHLTSLVLPPVESYEPNGSPHGLRAIVARLRAPEIGCPWDLQQTHRTLIPYAIEEAYEVVDAIEDDDPVHLLEELGDLLLQVVLHAEIADQTDEFDLNDVIRNISEKLVRRHPHVFGEVKVAGAADVVRNWDQLKAAERSSSPPPTSALDGVSRSLPQLKRAAEISRKATRAGFDWPTRDGTVSKVREELAELLAADSVGTRREELGDLLYILAKLAWQDGLDPEEALRAANEKFIRRFQTLEQIAQARGWTSLADRPLTDLEDAWQEAKHHTQTRLAPQEQP
jgi:tetrapyrrole methylase family protein / MazG family protein